MADYCEDCGCKRYGGICSNCQEELYIYENQSEYADAPYSEEFIEKVGEQRRELNKKAISG